MTPTPFYGVFLFSAPTAALLAGACQQDSRYHKRFTLPVVRIMLLEDYVVDIDNWLRETLREPEGL